jgi:hypothetical protein
MRKPYPLLAGTAALLVSFMCAPATAQVTLKQFVGGGCVRILAVE